MSWWQQWDQNPGLLLPSPLGPLLEPQSVRPSAAHCTGCSARALPLPLGSAGGVSEPMQPAWGRGKEADLSHFLPTWPQQELRG